MKNTFLVLLMVVSAAITNAQKSEVFKGKSGAINGYDAVAYFTDNKAVKGNPKLVYRWKDADWTFANEANRKLFQENPEKYVPQYGGYCAYGASEGHKAPTDPEAFTLVDGKLYLNYNQQVMAMWRTEEQALIRKADANWEAIKAAKE
ncbi:YHS domain-containing (seleno)protein [Flavobacterium sp.]|uniref:YHS domain-containing (seleno)protein n=1 Tax=Flavobacterium sp. TaxID=239 RepID=UPI002632E912|nr:YHS domain-containing (seleno)protein [Flavobacterium sp.]